MPLRFVRADNVGGCLAETARMNFFYRAVAGAVFFSLAGKTVVSMPVKGEKDHDRKEDVCHIMAGSIIGKVYCNSPIFIEERVL